MVRAPIVLPLALLGALALPCTPAGALEPAAVPQIAQVGHSGSAGAGSPRLAAVASARRAASQASHQGAPQGGTPMPPSDAPGTPSGGTSTNGSDLPPPSASTPMPASGVALATPSIGEAPLSHPWVAWWELAKGGYVLPKERVQIGGVTTGSADYFLGQGEEDTRAPEARRVEPARVAIDVVPALLAELDRDGSPEPLTEALLALGRVSPALDEGPFGAVRVALERFATSSGSRAVADAAVIALGLSGHDSVAPALARLLEAEADGKSSNAAAPARTRAFAAYGLALVARDSEREDVRRYAVAALWRGLDTADRGEADVPIACLLGLGLVPLERLVVEDAGGVPEPPSASRTAIARELGTALAPRRGARHEVRAHVPLALACMAWDLPAARFEELKAWLAEPLLGPATSNRRENPDVTQALALALGALADGDADPLDARLRDALLGLADNGDVATRNEALLALGDVAARFGHGSLPGAATESIGKRLLQELERSRGPTRPFAVTALGLAVRGLREQGLAAPVAWTEGLGRALESARTPEETVSACVAIGLAHETSLVRGVQEALGEVPAGWPRAQVALALGLLEDPSSGELLRAFAAEATQRPRDLRAAAEALFLIGDQAHATEMIDALEGASSNDAQALAYALGSIGDPEAVDALLEVLRSPSSSSATRAAASQALGRIADPRTRSPLQVLADVVVPGAAPAALFGDTALEAAVEDSPLPSAFLRGGGLLNLLP